jgi:hypothetical protein
VLGVRNEDVMGFLDSYVKEYTVDSSLFATSLAISIKVISRNSEVSECLPVNCQLSTVNCQLNEAAINLVSSGRSTQVEP